MASGWQKPRLTSSNRYVCGHSFPWLFLLGADDLVTVLLLVPNDCFFSRHLTSSLQPIAPFFGLRPQPEVQLPPQELTYPPSFNYYLRGHTCPNLVCILDLSFDAAPHLRCLLGMSTGCPTIISYSVSCTQRTCTPPLLGGVQLSDR